LRTIFRDIEHRVKVAARLEVDLLIPSHRIAIQYDGRRYHANKVAKDIANTSAVEALGYRTVRLRDHSLPEIGVTVPIDEDKELSALDLVRLLTQLHIVCTVDPEQLAAIHAYRLETGSPMSKDISTYALRSRDLCQGRHCKKNIHE
jgi:hypothetical protein